MTCTGRDRRPLRITRDRKVYFFGLRIHHGPPCAALAVLALIGLWHDRRDFPWPLRDRP